MSKITVGQLVASLQKGLSVLATIDPRAALASAGVEVLQEVFSTGGEIKGTLDQVLAETAENAPEVAKAVSALYTKGSDAVKASFAAYSGD